MSKFSMFMFLVVVGAMASCDNDVTKKSTLWCDNLCVNGVCTPEGDGARCVCDTGYTGTLCNECRPGYERDGNGACVPIVVDPCTPNPCENGECVVTGEQSIRCECDEGYDGLLCDTCAEGYEPDGNGGCEPIVVDPCDGNPCANGNCIVDGDSFVCDCDEGYTGTLCADCEVGFIELNNGTCVLDACQSQTCAGHGTCSVDLDTGMAACICNDGYEGTGLVCSDINECLTNPCLGHADCTNLDGSYECHCQIGYTGLGCDTCDDGFVNVSGACLANSCDPNPCLNDGTCVVNGGGVAECSCPAGYTGTYCQSCEAGYVQLVSGICVPDSCAGQTCSGHGECSVDLNTGNASCACDAGFTVSGLSCVDVDECSAGTDNCSDNATCSNTIGGFTCTCNAGYTGNGVTCTDVDECVAGTDNCDVNATCSNTIGGFTCTCNAGFSGDGVTCSDINECVAGTDNCDVNATCSNTIGGFTCTCNAGFSGDGVVCSDINECVAGTDNCDVNATCANTVGSFTCACNSGYSGDGVTCSDINECLLDPCPTNSTCANTAGSYTCTCIVGYTGSNCDVCDTANGYTWDGSECTLDPCFGEDCSGHGTCSVQGGLPVCTCETGYTGSDCGDCAENYRLMGGFCQPMFGRLAGGSIYNFVEVGGDLYGFGQNEVVVKYDEVEDTWLEVWRPDIDWTGNNTSGSVRNDFMAAATDGVTVYLLQNYFAKNEYQFITGSNRNIVRTFTPGASEPWGQIADIPPTGTQIAPIRCNDLGTNASGDLLWAVCDDGTVYKYNWVTNSWDGELVHDNNTSKLNKIWVESEDSIFVVGSSGFIKRWNGVVWEDWRNATLDTNLYGVWGYSSSDLYVGGQGKLWHYNGSVWTLKFSQTSNPTRHYVRKIHGTPDHSRIVALSIGDWNDWAQYTSHVWQSVAGGAWSSPGASMYYWSVYCPGLVDDSCYVGGSNGTIDKATRLVRLGSGGEERMLYVTLEPAGVFGNSPEDLLFVGLNTGTHFDGSRYADLPLDSVGEVGNLSFISTWSNGLGYWIVGPKNYVLYWDGLGYGVSNLTKHLIDTADFTMVTDAIYTVHGSSPSNVWVAGSRGATFRWNGTSWTRYNLPHTGARVTGILAISPSEVYATGRDWSVNDYVHVYKWNGAVWTVAYTYAQYDHSTYNLIKDGVHICTPFGDGSRAYVVCSSDAGASWSTFITTSAGNTSGKIYGSKNNLFFLSNQGRILNYRAGVETRIHRETSNQFDDDAFPTLVDVWQDPASDFTVIIGSYSKVLVHR